MDINAQERTWLLNEKYNGRECEEYSTDLKRLEAGEPLAYVIGFVPFLDTRIFLDSHPLIPRTETEYWVEQALGEMVQRKKPLKVLDLCAGSGCVGVAVLKHVPSSTVDFIEKEMRHHPTIRKNCEYNAIPSDRYTILGGDLFDYARGTYDFILSNPPYIDPIYDHTEERVRAYEPHEALYGGRDGTACISRIMSEASKYLSGNGVLYLEHEPEQSAYIAQTAANLSLICETQKDQFGLLRFTRLTREEEDLVAQ